jgi:hypothetical protein
MGSYVGAAIEYYQKGWKLVMRISQACVSQRHASLIGIRLSQASSLTGIYLLLARNYGTKRYYYNLR